MIKEKNLALSGNQVIGVDPATGLLHSWTFESDGGVGEADWSRDGDHWVLDADGTLADGRSLTETNVLRRVNEDTFTWQSVEVESISGSVDKATQRAAWTIGGHQAPVYEAGIGNLTKDETPILVHLGDGQSRQVALIRLPQPAP